jgi:hypothetical protein
MPVPAGRQSSELPAYGDVAPSDLPPEGRPDASWAVLRGNVGSPPAERDDAERALGAAAAWRPRAAGSD